MSPSVHSLDTPFHLRDAIRSLRFAHPRDDDAQALSDAFRDWWNDVRPTLPVGTATWNEALDGFLTRYRETYARVSLRNQQPSSLTAAVHAGMSAGMEMAAGTGTTKALAWGALGILNALYARKLYASTTRE